MYNRIIFISSSAGTCPSLRADPKEVLLLARINLRRTGARPPPKDAAARHAPDDACIHSRSVATLNSGAAGERVPAKAPDGHGLRTIGAADPTASPGAPSGGGRIMRRARAPRANLGGAGAPIAAAAAPEPAPAAAAARWRLACRPKQPLPRAITVESIKAARAGSACGALRKCGRRVKHAGGTEGKNQPRIRDQRGYANPQALLCPPLVVVAKRKVVQYSAADKY